MANGLNGQGVTLIGGLSEILANWICGHSMPISLSKLDVARFLPMHSNPEFLFQRVPEIASMPLSITALFASTLIICYSGNTFKVCQFLILLMYLVINQSIVLKV